MLVFIDESGDTGRKIERGSSRYFIISLVLFDDRDEAIACDRRISLLRRELKLPENFEFHFAHNSKRVKLKFLEAIQPYQFVYFSVVIDKDPQKLWGQRNMDADLAQIKYHSLPSERTLPMNGTIWSGINSIINLPYIANICQ